MKGFFFYVFILTTLALTSNCSSYFKRKSCEEINWHNHGHQVAMQGKRLSNDETYKSCVKVEAEMSHSEADSGFKAGMTQYCSLDQAFQNGKKGVRHNLQFCDVSKNSRMAKKHRAGVVEFCQRDNGYSFGAQGGVYNNICPKQLETTWLPEYRKGRKVYLKDQIAAKQESISHIEDEISDYERERRAINNQIILLPRGKKVTSERRYDPDSKTYKEERIVTEDDETRYKREELQSQLRNVSRKIDDARNRQKKMRGEIRAMKTEIRSLTRST